MQSYSVCFFYNTKGFSLSNRTGLKSFIQSLVKKERKKLSEIRIIFCGKAEMRAINKKYLNHNYDTDIITFPFSSPETPIEAELYINIPIIKRQSKDFNCSFKEELHRVIFHGVLHLCGYNDKSPSQITQMRTKENLYLEKYFS
jgi:probable rRNA maturation factor